MKLPYCVVSILFDGALMNCVIFGLITMNWMLKQLCIWQITQNSGVFDDNIRTHDQIRYNRSKLITTFNKFFLGVIKPLFFMVDGVELK